MKTVPDFWSRVDRCKDDDCWKWSGRTDGFGYGMIKVKGVQKRTHRHAWEMANGPIPAGKQINHTCDNPACCNPAHLYCGTQAENMRDKSARGRQATGLKNGRHTQPDRSPRGERVGGAKLTELDIQFVKLWLSNGYEGRQVAKAFNVTNSNISQIRLGRTWAHVA